MRLKSNAKVDDKRNDRFLLLICTIIFGLILARDIGGIGVNKYLLLSVSVVGMLFLSYSNFLCLLGVLFFFFFGIPSTYIYLAAVFVYLFKKRHKLDRTSIGILLFFMAWELTHSLVYASTFGPVTYVGYFCRLFLLFSLIRENDDTVDRTKIVKCFSIGVLFFISVMVLMYLKDNYIDYILKGWVRIGGSTEYIPQATVQEGMKMSTNTNNVAYFCVVGMAGFLYLIYRERKAIWSVFFFAVFALGSFTVSKTFFMISPLLIVCLINLVLFTSKVSVVQRILISVTFVVGIGVLLNTGTVNALFDRFDKVDYMLQDSRSVIFVEYWNAFWDHPLVALFGAGAFTHRQVLYPAQSTHNGLQQILVSYGFTGFVIFVTFLVRCLRQQISRSHAKGFGFLIKMVPLTVAFLFTQTIQFLNPPDLMLPYIIGMLAISADKNGGKNVK